MNFKFVTSSKKNNIEDTSIYKSLKKYPVNISGFLGGNEGLPKIYNKAIKDAIEENVDALILVHDDVWILDNPIQSIQESLEEFDVFGVAGCSQATFQEPALWHLMGGGFEGGHLHGCVNHGNFDNYYPTEFGPYPHRVVMIDGLFIVLSKEAMTRGLSFDEECPSGFHFYDLCLCERARLLGLKIGVGDVSLIHESPGLREFGEDWINGQSYYLEKYGN